MKLWELVSAFREHRGAVRRVLLEERWRELYLERFDRFELLDRAARDEILPAALTREIAAQIPDTYVYDADERRASEGPRAGRRR